MTNQKLTEQGIETRERIFEFILAYIFHKRYPPTLREIRDAVGLKRVTTIYHHLRKLEAEGRLERDLEVARGIRIPASVWSDYFVEYRCLYPFGCKETSSKAGSCRIHGTELVVFVNKKERSQE